MLAIAGLGEDAVDILGVGIRRFIAQEGRYFLRSGRNAGQVKCYPAGKGAAVRLGGRGEVFLRELFVDEGINGMLLPLLWGAFSFRNCRAIGLLVGPVGFIVGTLLNPFFDNLSLLGSEGVSMLGRGHYGLRVLANDSHKSFARLGVSGNNGLSAVLILGGSSLEGVEPQTGTTFLSIWAVAQEAGIGEDTTDVLVETNLILRG